MQKNGGKNMFSAIFGCIAGLYLMLLGEDFLIRLVLAAKSIVKEWRTRDDFGRKSDIKVLIIIFLICMFLFYLSFKILRASIKVFI